VRELRALRSPGGPRRVDDGRDVGQPGHGASARDLLVGHAGPCGLEILQPAGVDDVDGAEVRGPGGDLGDGRGVLGRLDDEEPDVGVGEDPLDLLRARRLVEGHRDAARGPDRPVEQRPLVARARHDAHMVAGLDATGDEALRHGDDLGVERSGGHGGPRVGERVLALHEGAVTGRADARGQQVVEVLSRIDSDQGGGEELVHSGSSDSGRQWVDLNRSTRRAVARQT